MIKFFLIIECYAIPKKNCRYKRYLHSSMDPDKQNSISFARSVQNFETTSSEKFVQDRIPVLVPVFRIRFDANSTSGKFDNTRTRSIWNTFSSYLNLLTFSNDSNAIRNITFDHFKILFSEQRVTILHTSNIRSNATHLFFSLSVLILGECYSGCVNRSACRSHFGHIGIDIAICVCSFVRAPCDPVPSQATMLKKTKGKMKRRNTESSMQLALQAAASNDPEPELF